ncbi:MAG: haloalkane dehalogenase [Acidimicrobiia bacterium]
MDLLTTPEHRFEALGFDFPTRRVEVGGVGIFTVDVGAGPVVLLMHGEPTWSYLYRKMIPPLVAAGLRVLAPDLVGFGRSDKPASIVDHTFAGHVAWMTGWFDAMEVDDVTLFGQDWGGLIGLRILANRPERFSRLVVSNTGLPTGDQTMSDAFLAWQEFARTSPEFAVGSIVAGGVVNPLTPETIAAYDAPFPDERFKAAPRAMPSLVPTRPDDPEAEANRRAWQTLSSWEGGVLTLFSDSDPITAGGERPFQKMMPGARGQPHRTITRAGHFVQEDAGVELAGALIAWL